MINIHKSSYNAWSSNVDLEYLEPLGDWNLQAKAIPKIMISSPMWLLLFPLPFRSKRNIELIVLVGSVTWPYHSNFEMAEQRLEQYWVIREKVLTLTQMQQTHRWCKNSNSNGLCMSFKDVLKF